MKTRKITKKRTALSTALITGAILFTLNAGVFLAILIADTVQGVQTGTALPQRSQPSGWFHLPLMLLTAAAVAAFPIGLWGCVLRRRAVAKRLSTPAPHGKYLLWGRNLRRHASIPARYGGLRPPKPLRPTRRRTGLR